MSNNYSFRNIKITQGCPIYGLYPNTNFNSIFEWSSRNNKIITNPYKEPFFESSKLENFNNLVNKLGILCIVYIDYSIEMISCFRVSPNIWISSSSVLTKRNKEGDNVEADFGNQNFFF